MDSIDKVFSNVPRASFLPSDVIDRAEYDAPINIGYGQTNSQPYTVQRMLTWLDPKPGDNILDVGSGSGWTTALLGHIVGANGHVTAVERIPELVTFGKANCNKLGFTNVEFHKSGKIYGWPAKAPYQRILVSAAATELPKELLSQLAAPGCLVIPIKNSILQIKKNKNNDIAIKEHPGFVFVPLLP